MFGIFDPDKRVFGTFYRFERGVTTHSSAEWYLDYAVEVIQGPFRTFRGEVEPLYAIRDHVESVLVAGGYRPTEPPTMFSGAKSEQRYCARKWVDAMDPVGAVAECLGVKGGVLVRATNGAWGTSHLPWRHQEWTVRFEGWEAPASIGELLMAAERGTVGTLFGRG